MPHLGPYRTSTIYLVDRQAMRFANPTPTGSSISDRTGTTWRILYGKADDNEENYGAFEGNSLIASLSLSAPSSEDDCPTPYWSVGIIEIVNRFQHRGIGPLLLDAVFAMRRQPLASDLNQDGGGADLWRRWIRNHPGEIELFGPTGSLGIVVETEAGYSPDPWANGNARLVRMR